MERQCPTLRNVLLTAIACQELNESARLQSSEDDVVVLHELANILIRVVKLGLTPILGDNGAAFTLETARPDLFELSVTLEAVRFTHVSLAEEEPNFYGAFHKAIPLKDLLHLAARIGTLIDELAEAGSRGAQYGRTNQLSSAIGSGGASGRGGGGGAAAAASAAPLPDDERSSYALDGTDGDGYFDGRGSSSSSVEGLVADVLSRLFWVRHFGRQAVSVPWVSFFAAFEEEYGKQPARVNAFLFDALAAVVGIGGDDVEDTRVSGGSGGGGGGGSEVTDWGDLSLVGGGSKCSESRLQRRFEEGCVQVATFGKLTTAAATQQGKQGGGNGGGGACGLHRLFQSLCDPVTVVFEMGTVEDNANRIITAPTLVQGLLGLPVRQICCGGQHAAVLTQGLGQIFTWGRGGFGRLGHGNTDTQEAPRLVETLKNVVCCQVACGFAYTAAVTVEGLLYTWGAGENGRLGLGDVEDRHRPCLVEELSHTPVRQVFAGSVHTCVLTRLGQVYSFGKHEYTGHGCASASTTTTTATDGGGLERGQQGDVLLPKLLRDAFGDKHVAQISVGPGGYHTIALTTDREVYTWGHNRVGQLGYSNSDVVHARNGEGAHFLPTPKAVASMKALSVRQVVAGWGHSAVLTMAGEVLICGRNFQGQLGLGDPAGFPKNERNHPYQAQFVPIDTLAGKRIKQIACGGEHSVALTEGGEVFTFGAGNKGQLGLGTAGTGGSGGEGAGEGLGNEHYPALLVGLKRTRREVQQVACGNNCTLILAGAFLAPTLRQRCVEVIRSSSQMMDQIESWAPCLPSELADEIKASPDLSHSTGNSKSTQMHAGC